MSLRIGWRRRVVTLLIAVVVVISGATTPGAASTPTEVPEPPGVLITVVTNGSDATFSFTSDIPGAASFDITTEHKVGTARFDAPPGTYTVTELGPPLGFTLLGVYGTGCAQLGPQTFEAVVSADDVTTCVVLNQQSQLEVVANAIGGDGTFTYTTDIPGLPMFEVSTGTGVGATLTGAPVGTWTITQQGPPAPFAFEGVEGCPPGPTPGSVIVTVTLGLKTTCRFANRAPGTAIGGPFVTGPFVATSSVPVSSLTPSGSQVGLGSPLPAAQVPPGAPDSLGTFAGISTENGGSSNVVDPTGAVGPGHYVQMVNTMFAVFAKDGGLLAGPININRLWTGAGGACESNNSGDPIVLYDQHADRWLLSQFFVGDNSQGPYGMCVAVSHTPDPTGAYHLYELPAPWNPDYPKIGVWDDAYYLTTQPGPFTSADLRAVDRDAMLAGRPTQMIRFSVNPTTFLLPADVDGSTPPPPGTPNWFTAFESPSTTASGPARLTVYAFDADFDDPAASSFQLAAEVPIAPFSPVCGDEPGGRCISVPGTDGGRDALDDVPMFRAAYRNFGDQQTIVGSFAHGVGTPGEPVAATRWWELRNTGGAWALNQEGDLFGGTLNRWAASAAQDRNGGLAAGYSVSDHVTFPSIRYAARSPLDPSGTIGPEATMVEGGGGPDVGGRWGDYTTLAVDPVDDCTFWYTNIYYARDGVEVSTAIGSFRRPDCAPVDLSVTTSASAASVSAGSTIDYAIEYANAAGTASEVVLTETVPVGTTFHGSAGWTGCAIGAPAGTVCTLSVGGLAPGQHGTATFSVRVDDATPTGVIANEAVLSAGYGGGEVRASNTTQIERPPVPTASPAATPTAVVVTPRFTG